MTGTPFTGRGPSGPSIDQVIAAKIGRRIALPLAADRRLAGIVRREHAAQHELGRIRARAAAGDDPAPAVRPPVRRARRGLGEPQAQHPRCGRGRMPTLLKKKLPTDDQARVDEHLSGIRDLERSIAGLPPEYRRVDPPDFDGDMKDWPRIAKLQSDLLVQALATRQTRVASYMLTKCQGLSRFPWLGLHVGAASRLHARGRQSAGRRRRGRPARPARHLQVARRGVRVPGGQAEVGPGRRRHAVRSHAAWCTCTSTPRRIRTRTADMAMIVAGHAGNRLAKGSIPGSPARSAIFI